jgi:hypothetical protein
MFILNFILFNLITKIIIANITEIISLNLNSGGTPYIKIEIGKNTKTSYNLVFDTSLHRSLLGSPDCKICSGETFNVNNSKKISYNQTELKYHYLFSGDEYEENAKISQKINDFKMNFISFTNVTFVSKIGTSGFLVYLLLIINLILKKKFLQLNIIKILWIYILEIIVLILLKMYLY